VLFYLNREEIKEELKEDKAAKGAVATKGATAAATSPKTDMEALRRLLLNTNVTANRNAPRNEDELRTKDEWKFWETQPVPQLGAAIPKGTNEPIQPNKPVEEIKQDPFSLPDGFKWDDIDLNNKDELMELYTLLNENYVEDDDNMFRFDYSPGFLKWYCLI
jgi:glycylpeptide N-tetradecanoyltransferase